MQNLLVTGGTEYNAELNPENSRTQSYTTEIYSPVTKKWSYAASLPSARRVARAATWNNLVYLLGEAPVYLIIIYRSNGPLKAV